MVVVASVALPNSADNDPSLQTNKKNDDFVHPVACARSRFDGGGAVSGGGGSGGGRGRGRSLDSDGRSISIGSDQAIGGGVAALHDIIVAGGCV